MSTPTLTVRVDTVKRGGAALSSAKRECEKCWEVHDDDRDEDDCAEQNLYGWIDGSMCGLLDELNDMRIPEEQALKYVERWLAQRRRETESKKTSTSDHDTNNKKRKL